MANTKKVRGFATGIGNQAQVRFNEDSCSDKVSETGLNFFHGASLTDGLLGALGSAVRCGAFKPVYIVNTANALAYVSFGASSMSAPSGGANGIPLGPYQGLMLSSGPNLFVRASAATVFGYVASENVIE